MSATTPIVGTPGSSIGAQCVGPDTGTKVMADDVNNALLSIENDLATAKKFFPILTKWQAVLSSGGETIAGAGAPYVDTLSFVDITGCKVGDLIQVLIQTDATSTSTSSLRGDAYEDHAGANTLVQGVTFAYNVTTSNRLYTMIGAWTIATAGTARLMLRAKSAGGQSVTYGDGIQSAILAIRTSNGL